MQRATARSEGSATGSLPKTQTGSKHGRCLRILRTGSLPPEATWRTERPNVHKTASIKKTSRSSSGPGTVPPDSCLLRTSKCDLNRLPIRPLQVRLS